MNYNFEKTNHQIATNGKVTLFYGTQKETNTPVAMKYYDFTTQNTDAVVRQMSVLKRLEHPNLARIYNYYESSTQTCIVSELVKRNLVSVIIDQQYYCEDECKNYIIQLVNALEYLHQHNIPSLNLKTNNIMFDGTNVKIIDYGLKEIIPDEFYYQSVFFVAPEVISNLKYDNQPDIFALGVLTHLLLTGTLPYEVENDDEEMPQKILFAIANRNFKFHMTGITSEAQDFIKQCMKNIDSRPNIFQLKKHPWLTNQAPVIPLLGTQKHLRDYQATIDICNNTTISTKVLKIIVGDIFLNIDEGNSMIEEICEEENSPEGHTKVNE